ncbi:MAG: hypothetical protein RI571_10800 [Roseovarius sp.]|nr:hypothetical protein [Roseovarius sp.]
MFRKIVTKAATDFEPSTDVFPSIAVAPIARSLRPEKRGHADGKKDYPPVGATSLTTAEQEAVAEIARRRKSGIDAFDTHFNAYQGRFDLSQSAVSRIEVQAGKLRNVMVSESRTQKNIATNCLRAVRDYSAGLKEYQLKHGLIRPPEEADRAVYLWTFTVLFLVIEIILGAMFFVEHSPGGILGSASYAVIISGINVAVSALLGLGARYAWLKGFGYKLLGVTSMLIFPLFMLGFNLFVGHYRRATDEMPWEEAGNTMFDSFRTAPFDLGSFNAILIAVFGLIVAISAFIKFLRIGDIHPGYNKAYDRVRNAVEDYADAYKDAEYKLNELFDQSRDSLMSEAHHLRSLVRDASNAQSGQSTLVANLEAFLVECDQVANGLLRIYREANEQARSAPPPAYFRESHTFPACPRKKISTLGSDRIEAEISRINTAAEVGVRDILEARKNELSALPTTEELLEDLYRGTVPEPVSEPPLEIVAERRG